MLSDKQSNASFEMALLQNATQECFESYRAYQKGGRGSDKAYKTCMRALRKIKNSITPIRKAMTEHYNGETEPDHKESIARREEVLQKTCEML